MGPRAVERHVQSTRHKKIVAALGMNPQEFNSSDSMSPLTSVEAMLASSSTCTNRNLFYDIDTSTPVDIFDVRSGDTVPGVCAPLQSVLQTTMASNGTVQQNYSKADTNGSKSSGAHFVPSWNLYSKYSTCVMAYYLFLFQNLILLVVEGSKLFVYLFYSVIFSLYQFLFHLPVLCFIFFFG